jgi:hypothetical protein
VSAELAARRTAAAAVLADYQRGMPGADVADRALWAARLADMLGLVLAGLGAEIEKLEEIQLVLKAFDWETDDRQYALEQIVDVVNAGVAGHAPEPAIGADADMAWLRERATETLWLRGRVADLADELDREAGVITPSKAAEIKRGIAARIRAALEAGK